VHTSIDEALEVGEMPAAPGVLAEIVPLSETVAPRPMTQRRVLSPATPIIGENLLQTLGGAVDNFIVARVLSSDGRSSHRARAPHALSFALRFWAVWFVSSGSLRCGADTRIPLVVGASTMWLSVLLAWGNC
jgi:Na+-driven multidrug efflux pump